MGMQITKEEFLKKLVLLVKEPAKAGHLDDLELYDRFIGDLVEVVADHTGVMMSGRVNADGHLIIDVSKDETNLFKKIPAGNRHWVIHATDGSDNRVIETVGSFENADSVRRAHFSDPYRAVIEPKDVYEAGLKAQQEQTSQSKPGC